MYATKYVSDTDDSNLMLGLRLGLVLGSPYLSHICPKTFGILQ